MNIALLFRKRTPLTEDGMPWISGSEQHPWPAVRNTTGAGVISAILVRALLSALEGNLSAAGVWKGTTGVMAVTASRSTRGATAHCWLDWDLGKCGVPHGEPDKVTYHLGLLAIVEALAGPVLAADFWFAYEKLLLAYRQHGRQPAIKADLCRAADELYYWLRFAGGDPQDGAASRLESLQIGLNDALESEVIYLPVHPLTDPDALRRLQSREEAPPDPLPAAPIEARGFVGWQAQALSAALQAGENVLLAGPTGTGKTFATQQAVLESCAELVVCEGKEGLMDLDFLGAILPQAGSAPSQGEVSHPPVAGFSARQWVDGPLLRAMRRAASDPVCLFLDEVNRIPRQHLNLLLGLMNPKTGVICRAQGMRVSGEGPFYVIEVPMTSEVVACPAAHLRIVAAGNFGRAYQVYDLDPAVRRRFDTVIEFDYLSYADELSLVNRQTAGITACVAEALVKMAHETRRMMANGELPGCIDTASLLNWARKCQRSGAGTVVTVMNEARLTWTDLVCGRDHIGKVNSGSFQALQDYLVSLGLLPDDTTLSI